MVPGVELREFLNVNLISGAKLLLTVPMAKRGSRRAIDLRMNRYDYMHLVTENCVVFKGSVKSVHELPRDPLGSTRSISDPKNLEYINTTHGWLQFLDFDEEDIWLKF